ncbi:MAG TPA: type VI secretion system baseplate subunit TssF [Acidobacteriota bacterium]|nr:type VI secretion system baseplate subunit TssF [Acidobacteriota bacterium]
MFNKYYQDELTYLRALGREFADAYPQAAHMLAETGTDPDVERLLEGFAFLTGRLRQRLDAELPELTHAFVGLLWPHYLRPIPAMSIAQFTPAAALQDTQMIARGTPIESSSVEGTRCRFRTTAEVRLYPFALQSATLDVPLSRLSSLKLQFAVGSAANPAEIDLGPLRLFLSGEPRIVGELYLWLARHVRDVVLQMGTQRASLGRAAVVPTGFDDDEALLPYPRESFPGYRFLQEFFALPERYHFVDVETLAPLARMEPAERFEIIIEFDARPPDGFRVSADNVRLGCVPIVNLQGMRSAPIRVDHEKTEYRLRADATNPAHHEIFAVNRVTGWTKGTLAEREYKPFFSYDHVPGGGNGGGVYHSLRLHPATVGSGTETYISFVSESEVGIMPPTETVAADLTCTNRNLPAKLHPGDINVATTESPAFATFTNITRVTPAVPPPLEGRLLWHLISHLSLNHLTLASIESLRSLLGLYNFHALVDRQAAQAGEMRLAGIRSVRARPDELLRRGAVYRGVTIDLEMAEDHFAGEGEMYLMATVLNRFFSLYTTLNAFTRLRVREVQKGAVYTWPPLLGQKPLV